MCALCCFLLPLLTASHTAVCAQPVPKQRWQSLIFSSNCSRTILSSLQCLSHISSRQKFSFFFFSLRKVKNASPFHSRRAANIHSKLSIFFHFEDLCAVFFSSQLFYSLSASSLTADDSKVEVEDEEHFSLSSTKKKTAQHNIERKLRFFERI